MEIREIMADELKTLKPDDSIRTAADKMKNFHIGAMPVMKGDDCVGMVTDRDIVIRGVAEERNLDTNVNDIMTSKVYDIDSHASAQKAAEMMEKNQVRRLVVKNDDGNVAGILSLGDIATTLNKEIAGEAIREVSKPAPGESKKIQ